MATARLIGKIGGGPEWVASGVTGTGFNSYRDVATSPNDKITTVEFEFSGPFSAAAYRIDGGTQQQLDPGTNFIVAGPGQTISVNDRATAVRYVMIDI